MQPRFSPAPRLSLKRSGLVLAGVLSLAALSGCGKQEPQAAATAPATVNAIAITVAPAESRELQRKIHIVGSLVGLESATLSNRVQGVVVKVQADLGSRVKPGEPLAQIDAEQYAMALRLAEQTLQETLAKLGLKEVPSADANVDDTAPVRKALSDLANAKNKYDRATPLNAQKIIDNFEYQDIATAYQSAQSALATARDDARALLAKARQNLTQIDIARKQLRDTTIIAPDGTSPEGIAIDSYAVSDRKATVGEMVKDGTVLFSVVADHVLKLQARVPEKYLGQVAKGQKVAFGVEAFAGQTFEGTVHKIDPGVDPATRSFRVEALVQNPDGKLRPGSFVEGDVLTRKDTGVTMVPLEAVTSFAGVEKVFALSGETAADGPKTVKPFVVKTGQQDGKWVEVLGVAAGSQVATSGQSKLFDGAAVRIVDSGGTPTTMAAK